MASWQTIQSLLIFFGPLLAPRILAYYRSLRNRPASQIRPLPPKTSWALGILFITGTIAFLSTFPIFHPLNIFALTSSRLHTSPGVLNTRLAALRPLQPFDLALRAFFDKHGLEARLLYARFGPTVLVSNPFTHPGAPDAALMYLLYATPSLLAPHILHVLALGIATSGSLTGAEGARWRTVATIAGVVLGIAEFAWIAMYDDSGNARSTRVGEVDFIFWKMRVWRGLAMAAVDGVLGWVIYLQASGRAFLAPRGAAERVNEVGAAMEGVLGRLRGVGTVRNGVGRSVEMRKVVDDYWVKEGEVMRDVLEEPEVLQAQRNVLRRLDSVRVGRDAEAYLDAMLTGMVGGGGNR